MRERCEAHSKPLVTRVEAKLLQWWYFGQRYVVRPMNIRADRFEGLFRMVALPVVLPSRSNKLRIEWKGVLRARNIIFGLAWERGR